MAGRLAGPAGGLGGVAVWRGWLSWLAARAVWSGRLASRFAVLAPLGASCGAAAVLGLAAFRFRVCVFCRAARAVGGVRVAVGVCVFENACSACVAVAFRFSFRVLCSRLLGSRVSVRVIVVAFLVLLDLLVFANLCRRLAAADFSEKSPRFAPAVRNFARENFFEN